jgi:glycosyltransferase involved in cell wall biosynthesis
MKHYKTAIVHDLLIGLGGAENTLESIYQLYPSPIHTLILNKQAIRSSPISKATIVTSFIQGLPWCRKMYRTYLPLYPIAIEQFDLRGFDIILSSSYIVAKGILSDAEQLHICYLHNPIRPAWELYHKFLSTGSNGKGLKGFLSRIAFHYLRNWDVVSANRVDHFIANSNYTANRIKKLYQREAVVIYPPVNIDAFDLEESKENYYITVSRLVYHKRVDLIVKAFSKMPDKQLIIIGDGPELTRLKAMALPNIKLLGYQPNAVLVPYLQKARAFVFAAHEDFGIAPIEAMACGTPVLALKKGGCVETVINKKTGLFFLEETVESICDCVNEFESINAVFNAKVIRAHAENFSRERFEREFKSFTDKKAKEFFESKELAE